MYLVPYYSLSGESQYNSTTFNVKFIWRQNLRSVGFDLRYVIRFFGRHFIAILIKTYEWISVGDKQIRTFCLLPSLSSLDHYQPSSFSCRADNGLSGW